MTTEPSALEQIRDQVAHLRDHLRERPEMTPHERGQVVGARTMAAAVLQMITSDDTEAGTDSAPAPEAAVLRLVRDDDR